MSECTYNGITLDGIKTHTINGDAIYTSDTTDYLYTKLTVNVQGVLNMNFFPATEGEAPIETAKRIRACLMCPRKTLTFKVDDKEYITSPDGGHSESCDAHNGPLPQYFNLTSINGAETILYDFCVITYVRECCGGSGNDIAANTPIISHRFTEQSTIDELFRTTRNRRGILYFKTNSSPNPDDFRYVVCPPLLPKFMRIRQNYIVSEDGTQLMYDISDQEVKNLPPSPAVKIGGSHLVTSNKGAIHYQEITVKLWGAPTTSKKALIDQACVLAFARVEYGLKQGKTFCETASLRDSFEENSIELSMRFRITARKNTNAGMNSLLNNPYLDKFINEPASKKPPDPGTRGTALLELVKAQFWPTGSNCNCPGVSPNAPGGKVGMDSAPVLQPLPNKVGLSVVPALPNPTQVALKNDPPQGLYNEYIIDITYKQKNHVLQMPIISSKGNNAAFANLAAPTILKCVDFTCESVGEKPTLPTAESFDSNEVLINKYLKPASTELTSDGKPIYRITGQYIYGLKNADSAVIAGGRLPYTDLSFDQSKYNNSDFERGLTSKF